MPGNRNHEVKVKVKVKVKVEVEDKVNKPLPTGRPRTVLVRGRQALGLELRG
jgi:hypothetical protein